MYSVLFQSQKIMEYYEPYRPIFMPLIRSGRMGLCQWMEAGTTVDTVIPGIYDLISDKEEWRAIILCMNEKEDQESFPSKPENPYDFIENSALESAAGESRIPLIRLAQMLGGVPAPAMHFESRIIKEKDKEERMIYVPVVREEDQKASEELKQKYQFHGKLPDEIILVCPRNRRDIREDQVDQVWKNSFRSAEADFWKRNGYPTRCRFTVFDITREGDVRKAEELFNLWTAVMLLASNAIDPSTLQAYRLYRISVEFDKKKLEQTIQATAGRVYCARCSIEKSIKRELEKKLSEEVLLPDYEQKAPVVLKLPDQNNIFPEGGRFGLTARTPSSDREILRNMKEQAEKELSALSSCTGRALDQTARKVRRCSSYSESEVYDLDLYQKEDMEDKLAQEYRQIFELRKRLPLRQESGSYQLNELAGNIQHELTGRMTHGQAAAAFAAVSVLFGLSMAPVLFFRIRLGRGSVLLTLMAAAVGIAAFAGAQMLCLTSRKLKLQSAVSAFHSFLNGAVNTVSKDGQLFSDYMGKIASYLHGTSFLTVLEQRPKAGKQEFSEQRMHIAALSDFFENLKEWCRAYHLRMYFDSNAMYEEDKMDLGIPPEVNPMYTFELEENCPVEVNHTGDTIESPFGFVRKLKIIREELCDDAK